MESLISHCLENGGFERLSSQEIMMSYIRSLIDRGALAKAEEFLNKVWEVS